MLGEGEESDRRVEEEPGRRAVEEPGYSAGYREGEEPGQREEEEPGQMEGDVSVQSTRSRIHLQSLKETPVRGRIRGLSYRSATVTRFA